MKIELDLTQEELELFEKTLYKGTGYWQSLFWRPFPIETALYEKIKQQISQQTELKKPE